MSWRWIGYWHPPMSLPCDPDTGFAIDRCHTLESLLEFVGSETWRIRLDCIETCPHCGHIRARRVPA